MANIDEIIGSVGFYENVSDDVVLLIHGLTGTPTEMRYIGKSLVKQGFSVVCPQLAGHCGNINDLKKSRWQDWYLSVERTFDAIKKLHPRVFVSGLSAGALIAIELAKKKQEEVSGLGLLSPTFFYDGWNMPKFKRKFLLPLVLNSPLRYFLSWKELPPYGIKCDRTRSLVHAILENKDVNAAGKVGVFKTPAITIKENMGLINSAQKSLSEVHSPTLIVHSIEDDMASLKNAEFVEQHISSPKVELFVVNDSYHVLTLDRQKYEIAQKMAKFFKECPTKELGS